jgi:hypothetical protein
MTGKIYEFTLDEVQITHIRHALEGDRYAVAKKLDYSCIILFHQSGRSFS